MNQKDKWMRGIPYQGNKGQKAQQIMDILPGGKRLIDLFGGGGSISLFATQQDKWQQIIYNELNRDIYQMFTEFIINHNQIDLTAFAVPNRERFFDALKKTDRTLADNIILTCWSFSNDRRSFLWGKKNEIKILVSRALFFGDTGTKYDALYEEASKLTTIREKYAYYHKFRLERLQQLEQLEQLEVSNKDYADVQIGKDDVVYCDPPYGNSRDYKDVPEWNPERFHEWYMKCPAKDIYISEYTPLPDTEIVADLGNKHRFTATCKRKHELLLKVKK
ncbi:MAG TPA: DNA adenine methylase [Limosilactobacillus oris]|uniref:DNA adenine methylase n=1 Tax=Limosilactobacillus oris TaxID=1632 RepID=UPI001D5F9B26|nr:DNA adenine methylase [Limosilactobacillus oris]HJF47574.1 DNA adenine methylase [Limosilactobacillus oris]